MRQTKHNYTIEELTKVVAESYSYAECLRKFDIPVHGSMYNTLKARIKQHELSIEHFTGVRWNKGLKKEFTPKYTTQDILANIVPYVSGAALRKRLTKEGYFDEKCYGCHLTEWRGKPIPLELDHINGDHYDNTLVNLTVLCPNCHAMTETYAGKNIKVKPTNDPKPKWVMVRQLKTRLKKDCPICKQGFETLSQKQVYCSKSCAKWHGSSREVVSKADLAILIWKHPFTTIAKMYNVSGKTIGNYCRRFDLTIPPKGHWITKKTLD